MTTPYENLHIGTFIYSLGYLAARHLGHVDVDAAVNLYQQPPGDTALGDFLYSLSGRSVLIEFKRDREEISAEIKKPIKAMLINSLREREDVRSVSEKMHFLAYPDAEEGSREYRLLLTPYAFLATGRDNRVGMDEFISSYFNQEIGGKREEFKLYLKALLMLSEKAGAGAKPIPGLVLNIDSEGRVHCLSFDDVRQFDLEMDKRQSRSQQERTREQDWGYDRGGFSR